MGRCLNELGIYPHRTDDASSGADRFMVFRPELICGKENVDLPEWYLNMSVNRRSSLGICNHDIIAFHGIKAAEQSSFNERNVFLSA